MFVEQAVVFWGFGGGRRCGCGIIAHLICCWLRVEG
jgi:hypothetical protein